MLNIETPKISFRQFPVTLRLSIAWIYLISFDQIWGFIAGVVNGPRYFLISLTFGIVFLVLAIGLVWRLNISRLLTVGCLSIASLIRLTLLVIIVINDFDWVQV